MKYKIIEMQNGIVTMSKEDMEVLLNEVYQEGYEMGYKNNKPYYGYGTVRPLDVEPTTCLLKQE